MANISNSKKNVKRNKPNRKAHAEFNEKNPIQKTKMRGESKQSILMMLMQRREGATIDEMAKTTDWQRHSIRGMMSGVLKKRLKLSITSEKEERGRVYRIAA